MLVYADLFWIGLLGFVGLVCLCRFATWVSRFVSCVYVFGLLRVCVVCGFA